MDDWDATALEIVEEFGGVAKYIKNVPGVYNPATGTVTKTTSELTCKAVLLDLTLQSNGLSTKYGTTIIAGDKEAYVIPPVKFGGPVVVPDPVNDRFSIGGVSYSIVTFKEINPTGTNPIVFFLYLRK